MELISYNSEEISTSYILSLTICAIVSYIIGSLNSAIIVVFLMKRKDIREYGSKNAGLTNVYRCFGTACAAVTLAMDLLKGFIVVFGTKGVLFASGLFSKYDYDEVFACLIVSACAVLGHVFPVFYRFKGGKGILIASMCTLAIEPIAFLCGLIVMVVMTAITRYISVGSICCCIGYPFFFILADWLKDGINEKTYIHAAIAALMGIFCIVRHAPNIVRLAHHEENKFSLKKDGGSK